jgi:Protein of unknown function (DUF1419)
MTINYIINPIDFKGRVQNTMTAREGHEPTTVDYTQGLTFDEYNRQHDGQLIIVSEQELDDEWLTPYYLSIQKPWVEITEEKYYDMLHVLPPLKQRSIAGYHTFFLGECFTGTLYDMYAKEPIDNKYYHALRDIHRSIEDLSAELSGLNSN